MRRSATRILAQRQELSSVRKVDSLGRDLKLTPEGGPGIALGDRKVEAQERGRQKEP
jgi:hypothetical protein